MKLAPPWTKNARIYLQYLPLFASLASSTMLEGIVTEVKR